MLLLYVKMPSENVITDLTNQGYKIRNEDPTDRLFTTSNQIMSSDNDGLVRSIDQPVSTKKESPSAVRLVTPDNSASESPSPDTDSFDKLHPEAQPVSDSIENTTDLHETHSDVQKRD